MVKILKAYADETRLKIMKLLLSKKAKGGLCVCQIQNALKMKQAAVSKAMNVLKNAGAVTSSKKGLWVYYSAVINAETESINAAVMNDLLKDTDAKKTAESIKAPEVCCSKGRC